VAKRLCWFFQQLEYMPFGLTGVRQWGYWLAPVLHGDVGTASIDWPFCGCILLETEVNLCAGRRDWQVWTPRGDVVCVRKCTVGKLLL
jgi:hypothetical protein